MNKIYIPYLTLCIAMLSHVGNAHAWEIFNDTRYLEHQARNSISACSSNSYDFCHLNITSNKKKPKATFSKEIKTGLPIKLEFVSNGRRPRINAHSNVTILGRDAKMKLKGKLNPFKAKKSRTMLYFSIPLQATN